MLRPSVVGMAFLAASCLATGALAGRTSRPPAKSKATLDQAASLPSPLTTLNTIWANRREDLRTLAQDAATRNAVNFAPLHDYLDGILRYADRSGRADLIHDIADIVAGTFDYTCPYTFVDRDGKPQTYATWRTRTEGEIARPFEGDINRDGRADLIFVGSGWNGCGPSIHSLMAGPDNSWSSATAHPGDELAAGTSRAGDFDGDGQTDLVFLGDAGNGQGLNARLQLSKGDGSWNARSAVLGDGSAVLQGSILTGDVDGDWVADLMFVGTAWSGPGLNVRTKFSNGDGTWRARSVVLGDGIDLSRSVVKTGDVNGDGRTDLIFIGNGWDGPGLNVRVKLSNWDGTWLPVNMVLGDNDAVLEGFIGTGDVNGDGRTDLIFAGNGWSGPGLNIRTKLARGDGTWDARSAVLGDGAAVLTGFKGTGDVNGDGRTDVIFAGDGWSGPGLNVRTKLSNGDGAWTARSAVLGDENVVLRGFVGTGDVNGDRRTDLILAGDGWGGPGLDVRTKVSSGNGLWTSFDHPEGLDLRPSVPTVAVDRRHILFLASRALNACARLPASARTNDPAVRRLIASAPIIYANYANWILRERNFSLLGYGCRPAELEPQPVPHLPYLRARLSGSSTALDDPSWCNAFDDTDILLAAGLASFLTANVSLGRVVTVPAADSVQFLSYFSLVYQYLESRFASTSLQRFDGARATGSVLDPGRWSLHPSHSFAATTSLSYPDCAKRPLAKTTLSWDLSHWRYWIRGIEALRDQSWFTSHTAQCDSLLTRLANQYAYACFNRKFDLPLFSNYLDGSDGWYRTCADYEGRKGFGYGPGDLSVAAVTGGYARLARYNLDVDRVTAALWSMIVAPSAAQHAHMRNHYGTYWMNLARTGAMDIDPQRSFDLLQFVPDFVDRSVVGVAPIEAEPDVFVYPNPSHGAATIQLTWGQAEPCMLELLDIAGRRVAHRAQQMLASGETVVDWQFRDATGRPTPAGVYLLRISGASRRITTRIVIVQ